MHSTNKISNWEITWGVSQLNEEEKLVVLELVKYLLKRRDVVQKIGVLEPNKNRS